MQKLFLTLLLAISAASGANAEFKAADAFKSAPLEVLPLIDFTKRIEMIQLFDAGMAEKAANNVLGGQTEVLSLSNDAITLRHASNSTLTIALLPMAKGDTAVMFLENLSTPAQDANIRVYTRQWGPIHDAYTEPTVNDWATKGHLEEVQDIIPFMLAKGEWNPTTGTITLTPTINQWIGEDSVKLSNDAISPYIKLKWNGKKFVLKK